MCGRFTRLFSWLDLHKMLSAYGAPLSPITVGLKAPPADYNIPPGSPIPVLRAGQGGLDAILMRWWLTPSWADSPDMKFPMFNARSETAATKPAFKTAYKRRRCVIPASGFYEWAKVGERKKRPYYITRADDQPMFFAGLWECWRDELETCTLLTTSPNAEMREIHDRMPCLLEPEQVAGWVDRKMDDPPSVAGYLRSAPDGTLKMHGVGSRVGSVSNNGPALIDPDTETGLFGQFGP